MYKNETCKLHELQNIHAHTHYLDRIGLARTRLRGLHHELDRLVPHWGTVALKGKPNGSEEARSIKKFMLKLLLDKRRIEKRTDVRRLCAVLCLLCLCLIYVRASDTRQRRADGKKKHLEEFVEKKTDSGWHSQGDDVKCWGKCDGGV
jgi:hypothetical protein